MSRRPEPWLEQWANEEIFSRLAALLGIPCIDARAGVVQGIPGAITVFMEGNKVSALQMLGFAAEPVVGAATNRNQFGAIVSLDVWLMNSDRAPHNIFITTTQGRPNVRLIDHGHILLLPRQEKVAEPEPEDWDGFVRAAPFSGDEWTERLLSGNYLRQFVTAEEIVAGAANITSLGDDEIRASVEAVDDQFFFAAPDAIVTLLLQRRDSLAPCLEGVL
jgi:hypothetical protein